MVDADLHDKLGCDLLSECDFYYIAHNNYVLETRLRTVVICFQNVIFTILHTIQSARLQTTAGCDLLSECDFYYIAHNQQYRPDRHSNVVICFLNVFLLYCTQLRVAECQARPRCDLLSKCVFTILHTINNIALIVIVTL